MESVLGLQRYLTSGGTGALPCWKLSRVTPGCRAGEGKAFPLRLHYSPSLRGQGLHIEGLLCAKNWHLIMKSLVPQHCVFPLVQPASPHRAQQDLKCRREIRSWYLPACYVLGFPSDLEPNPVCPLSPVLSALVFFLLPGPVRLPASSAGLAPVKPSLRLIPSSCGHLATLSLLLRGTFSPPWPSPRQCGSRDR